MKGYRTFVESEEMNHRVQDKAVKLGYKKNHYATEHPFLYFSPSGEIRFGTPHGCENFVNHEYEYISAQDFLALPEPEQAFDLQPFERVLVRDEDDDKWRCDMFSHANKALFVCVGLSWHQIARYEGNEQYLGTTDNIPGAWKK